jgi:hypothetical protein
MRWFLTHAQEAELRSAISATLHRVYEAAIKLDRDRLEGEIARLRDDRTQELARFTNPQGPFVAHLREEVAYWRVQFERERQRAELAIDQCRVTHHAIGPVSLPLREPIQQAQEDVNAMFRDPELAAMGMSTGV